MYVPNPDGRRNNLVVLSTRKGKASRSNNPIIRQADLEELLGRRRGLMEMEERMAVALSRGARVEQGIHTAELVPERRRCAGRDLIMKLVITLFLFVVLPLAISHRPVFENLNGDGKIDIVYIELELTGANAVGFSSAELERTAHV